MITVVQSVADAVQFDGTAGAGLIDFMSFTAAAAGWSDPTVFPVVQSITLHTSGSSFSIDCFLKPDAEPITTRQRHTIVNPSTVAPGFSLVGCNVYVPRTIDGVPGSTPWNLVLISTGKTQTADLIVTFTAAPPSGGRLF
jgi:hypothetical protein